MRCWPGHCSERSVELIGSTAGTRESSIRFRRSEKSSIPLFFVSIVAIIIAGAAPLWFCIAVLVREIAIALATLLLVAFGARRIDVTWMGKAATFGLMFAFPGFLWASTSWPLQSTFEVLAWICAIPALLASYYAAALYVPLGLRALHDGRAPRHRGD